MQKSERFWPPRYLTALEYTSAEDAALLSPLQPVMAVLLGICAGLETASIQRIGGVLFCALGSLCVTVFSKEVECKLAR